MLRLPLEVAGLFESWLQDYFPERAARVMKQVRDLHQGKFCDSRFGRRMTGSGVFARLVARRFEVAAGKLGYGAVPQLREELFTPPAQEAQLSLPGF